MVPSLKPECTLSEVLQKRQTLSKLMRYPEIDRDVELSQLDPSGYDVVALAGKKYKFANGREHFIQQMTEYFPDQHENLIRYYDPVEKIAQGFFPARSERCRIRFRHQHRIPAALHQRGN